MFSRVYLSIWLVYLFVDECICDCKMLKLGNGVLSSEELFRVSIWGSFVCCFIYWDFRKGVGVRARCCIAT